MTPKRSEPAASGIHQEGAGATIDRTELDLRLATHRTTAARCNARGWQCPSRGSRYSLSAALAGWRAALAARDTPRVVLPARRPGLARR